MRKDSHTSTHSGELMVTVFPSSLKIEAPLLNAASTKLSAPHIGSQPTSYSSNAAIFSDASANACHVVMLPGSTPAASKAAIL